MDRRIFLRGLLIGASAGVAHVKLASPEETKALELNAPILIGHPQRSQLEDATGALMSGDPVYVRSDGQFVPIGIITEIRRMQTEISVGDAWTGEIRYMPGLKSATISFEGES
jgi:hypothetical protein